MTNKKVCTRCVMDESAAGISFDENGVCSFCTEFLSRAEEVLTMDQKQKDVQLDALAQDIRQSSPYTKYDCIVGVSGGVDSSWALVQAVKLGLKPLAVHMDNGWNSELAQSNINNLINKLDVDLYTHVIEWEEYKGLMQSFFNADVIDVELLYDNAMLAVNYKLAKKMGVKYILSGINQATEGIRIPSNWNWFKLDKKNIKSLALRSGVTLKTFPSIGTLDWVMLNYIYKIKWLSFLDYFHYNKSEAVRHLVEEYKYKPYPYKHYESIFTRFYQGYILPRKFGVDKRVLHLSNLVVTGQLSRELALRTLESIPYPTQAELSSDLLYFIKKMDWTTSDLENYISRNEISHSCYGTEFGKLDEFKKFVKFMLPSAMIDYIKKFYSEKK